MAKSPPKPHIPNFKAVTRVLRDTARKVVPVEVKRFADGERDNFVRRIEEQDFQSFQMIPLSKSWLARKKAHGADTRTMIATGWYKSQIKVYTRRRSGGWGQTLYIGFDKRTHARDLDGNVTDFLLTGKPGVAEVQEFGSVKAGVPARPHWGPHYKQMHKDAQQVRKSIRSKIMKEMRRRMPSF